jgi:RNA polymerase subunit RPABC4/transcription elongation factor Spt4
MVTTFHQLGWGPEVGTAAILDASGPGIQHGRGRACGSLMEQRTCPECGEPVGDSDVVCPNCGETLVGG